MPYDQGLIFQDGRPLIYDSGDYPALLAQLKDLIGWDEFADFQAEARSQGRRVGIGLACYVEGTGVGPYEGGHVVVETSGKVKVATGLTTQGQGHQTVFAQIVADELGVPLDDVEVVTGDTRRFGVRGRHVRLPRRGHERVRGRAGRPQGPGQGAAGGGGGDGGLARTTWRSSTGWSGSRAIRRPGSRSARWQCCRTRFVMRSTTRRRPRPSSRAAAISTSRRSPRTTSRGSRGAATSRRCAPRSPPGCTRRSWRPTRTRPRSRSCATAWCTTAAA